MTARALYEAARRWRGHFGDEGLLGDASGLSEGTSLLCCGLGALSRATFEARATRRDPAREAAVERAGALFSLLSKVDDAWIDRPERHEGRTAAQVRAEVSAYLDVTLDTIRAGAPDGAGDRDQLAAALGRSLSALGVAPSLGAILQRGAELQIETAVAFTRPPGAADRAQVAALTSETPAAWFLTIAEIGASAAGSGLSAEERAALSAWATWIQRADNLADLEGDLAEGHSSCDLGLQLFECEPEAWRQALRTGDARVAYERIAALDLDAAQLPTPEETAAASRVLSGLGALPAALRWIHGFLLARYLAHPLCARSTDSLSGAAASPVAPRWYVEVR